MLPLSEWYLTWVLLPIFLSPFSFLGGYFFIFLLAIFLSLGQSIALSYASGSTRAYIWMATSVLWVLPVFFEQHWDIIPGFLLWCAIIISLIGEALLYFIFRRFSRYRWSVTHFLALLVVYFLSDVILANASNDFGWRLLLNLGIFMVYGLISGLGIALGFPATEKKE